MKRGGAEQFCFGWSWILILGQKMSVDIKNIEVTNPDP